MPETDFFQSWGFWLILGIIIGFAAGFALAIILAACGRGSRMEEKMSDTMFKTVERGKSDFSNMAHKVKIVTQNNPRTD